MSLRKLASKLSIDKTENNKDPVINNLSSVTKNCRNCSLGCGAVVAPTGPDTLDDVQLIVIGEKPGNLEVKSGNHFVGELSKITRILIKKIIGIETRIPMDHGKLDLNKQERVVYTNAVLCKPGKDGNVTKAQYTACSKYNLEILNKTKCPVLLCGSGAIETYLPINKTLTVREARGKIYKLEGRSWICTFNPAVIQRGTFYREKDNKPDVCFDSMLWHFIRDLTLVKHAISEYTNTHNGLN